MAEFIIPKGKDFIFNIKVIEKDSLLPQDVETLDEISSTVEFIDIENNTCIGPEDITIVRIPDDSTANPLTYLTGLIKISIPSTVTDQMRYELGDKVDGYYLKPVYKCSIDLQFTDTTQNRVVIIDKVLVAPTGC